MRHSVEGLSTASFGESRWIDCAGCQQVSAFSTWEKELHKIVFDPRYLLLTSKERKQVFEQYVKERAEEERREKRNKLKEKKEIFRQLLEEAHLTSKYDLSSLMAF